MPFSPVEPVGFCIYCKRADLPPGLRRFSNEHILPLALGGKLILNEASCQSCDAKINSGFENEISCVSMKAAREKSGIRGRNRGTKFKKDRYEHVWVDNISGIRNLVSINDFPAHFPSHNYGTATSITRGSDPDLSKNGWWDMKISSVGDIGDFTKSHPGAVFSTRPIPSEWARLVLKVSYGLGVGLIGLENFTECISRSILGLETTWSRWIGGTLEGYPKQLNGEGCPLYHLRHRGGSQWWLVHSVRLMRNGPEYHVVLGFVDSANDAHRRWWGQRNSEGWLGELPPGFG